MKAGGSTNVSSWHGVTERRGNKSLMFHGEPNKRKSPAKVLTTKGELTNLRDGRDGQPSIARYCGQGEERFAN
jgi:hypothetical protein